MTLGVAAQSDRRVQYKPYIDLRPLHLGILVGTHLQDLELENVGPYTMTDDEGNVTEQYILCDADKWNPGFSVGVLAELQVMLLEAWKAGDRTAREIYGMAADELVLGVEAVAPQE